jgi:hypothetical protein
MGAAARCRRARGALLGLRMPGGGGTPAASEQRGATGVSPLRENDGRGWLFAFKRYYFNRIK